MYSPQKQMGRPKKRARVDEQELDGQDAENMAGGQTWETSNPDDFTASYFCKGLLPWPLDDATSNSHMNDSVPALTPDQSTNNSPPLLDLPPELLNTTHSSHAHSDPSTRLLLDPVLNPQSATNDMNLGLPPSLLPNCACLSTLYLTLSQLQTLDLQTSPFPFALHPLREAMQTASSVLSCQECPRRFISAIQNTQLLGTLIMSIAERFLKILEAINQESVRAEEAGEKKRFRLADLNTSTSHLHTAGIGCAAAFSLNLEPAEWRGLAKKVVRAEVEGPSEGNDCCAYLLGVVRAMETRQKFWHQCPVPEDFPKDARTGLPMGGNNIPKEDRLCLKLAGYARKLVEAYDWS